MGIERLGGYHYHYPLSRMNAWQKKVGEGIIKAQGKGE
jgi:hypothetical protein